MSAGRPKSLKLITRSSISRRPGRYLEVDSDRCLHDPRRACRSHRTETAIGLFVMRGVECYRCAVGVNARRTLHRIADYEWQCVNLATGPVGDRIALVGKRIASLGLRVLRPDRSRRADSSRPQNVE